MSTTKEKGQRTCRRGDKR